MWPFGKKKVKPPKYSEDDLPSVITTQRDAIELLEKRHIHLETKIKFFEDEARNFIKLKHPEKAKLALRRKLMHEEELKKLRNSRMTLESQILTLESAQSQQHTINALQTGIHMQKHFNEKLDVGKVDDLMSDLQEQTDLQNEISTAIGQGRPAIDEDELNSALDDLLAQEEEDLESVTGAAKAPIKSVSSKNSSRMTSATSTNSSKQLTEDEQLKALLGDLM